MSSECAALSFFATLFYLFLLLLQLNNYAAYTVALKCHFYSFSLLPFAFHYVSYTALSLPQPPTHTTRPPFPFHFHGKLRKVNQSNCCINLYLSPHRVHGRKFIPSPLSLSPPHPHTDTMLGLQKTRNERYLSHIHISLYLYSHITVILLPNCTCCELWYAKCKKKSK